MDMHKVLSSNIDSIGYDPTARSLRVAFKGGAVYVYPGVPPKIYDGLVNAESKGSFLAKIIRPFFHGIKESVK